MNITDFMEEVHKAHTDGLITFNMSTHSGWLQISAKVPKVENKTKDLLEYLQTTYTEYGGVFVSPWISSIDFCFVSPHQAKQLFLLRNEILGATAHLQACSVNDLTKGEFILQKNSPVERLNELSIHLKRVYSAIDYTYIQCMHGTIINYWLK